MADLTSDLRGSAVATSCRFVLLEVTTTDPEVLYSLIENLKFLQIKSESSLERLKLDMETMKQDKQREINKLEQTARQTMAENRQLKDDVRDKEEVGRDNHI